VLGYINFVVLVARRTLLTDRVCFRNALHFLHEGKGMNDWNLHIHHRTRLHNCERRMMSSSMNIAYRHSNAEFFQC
jgi:hypothetical protein